MTDAAVSVETVVSPRQSREFVSFPYRLYADDPAWVPPLRREEMRRWSPRHNPALRHRDHARFLARRNGRVVGRVAAIVDPLFTERWAPGTGFFGFLETIEDRDVARDLLETAEDFLRARGMNRSLGPVNLSTHDETGVLVDGFAHPPTFLSPHNPPYYATLLEKLGYRGDHEFHAYTMQADRPLPADTEAAITAFTQRASDRGISVRTADPSAWDRDKRILFDLYNGSFGDVWGFVPLRWEEFETRADSFRAFYRPELVAFAERDGVPVGFALILPDVNRILHGMNGRLLPLGWLRLMRGLPRLTHCRYILLGVLPDHLGNGISTLLGDRLRRNATRLGFVTCELSLVRDGNRHVERVLGAFGGKRLRTYRLYGKSLT